MVQKVHTQLLCIIRRFMEKINIITAKTRNLCPSTFTQNISLITLTVEQCTSSWRKTLHRTKISINIYELDKGKSKWTQQLSIKSNRRINPCKVHTMSRNRTYYSSRTHFDRNIAVGQNSSSLKSNMSVTGTNESEWVCHDKPRVHLKPLCHLLHCVRKKSNPLNNVR